MVLSIKTILKYISAIVVFILLYFVVKKIGLLEIYNNLKQANLIFLIIAFLSATTYFLIWNYRWYHIVKEIKKVKYLTLFPMFLTGVLLNTITPSARIGGEPLKAFYLSKKYKISKTKAFATTILDKIYNMVIFMALVIFSIIFVILYINIDPTIKTILISFLALILILLTLTFILRKKIKLKNIPFKKLLPKIYKSFLFGMIREKFDTYDKFEYFIDKKIHIFLKFIKKTLRKKKNITKGLLITSFFYLFKFLTVYFIFMALGHRIDFIPIVIVITLSTLLGDISFTPGGIGIIETLMITLYYSFGIIPALAVIVTVIDRAMFYFYSLGLGTISFSYLTLKVNW